MIFKPKLLYRTTKRAFLFRTDQGDSDPRDRQDVFLEVPVGSLVMFVAKGKFRFIKVIINEFTGYLWMPLNVATCMFLDPINTSSRLSFPQAQAPQWQDRV